MKVGDIVPLKKLKPGDTFWYFDRGWVVRQPSRQQTKDNKVPCLCLDDDGEPTLSGNVMVEVVTRG